MHVGERYLAIRSRLFMAKLFVANVESVQATVIGLPSELRDSSCFILHFVIDCRLLGTNVKIFVPLISLLYPQEIAQCGPSHNSSFLEPLHLFVLPVFHYCFTSLVLVCCQLGISYQ